MHKISKSDQDIEEEKANKAANDAQLLKLMTQPHRGTEPGDGCTIVLQDGTFFHGTYTQTGWIPDAEVQDS
jgi:hypothetical protein